MKTGLIMEGGAMRGLFTTGITDVLMENDITFDGAIGVSAGGTLAMNYAYTRAETSAIPIRFVCQLAAPTDFEPADWPLLMQINGIKTPEEFIRAMS